MVVARTELDPLNRLQKDIRDLIEQLGSVKELLKTNPEILIE